MTKIENKHISALAKMVQNRASSIRAQYLAPNADPDLLVLAEYAYLDLEKRADELTAMPSKALTQSQSNKLICDLLRKLTYFSSVAAQVQCLLEVTVEAKAYFSTVESKKSK